MKPNSEITWRELNERGFLQDVQIPTLYDSDLRIGLVSTVYGAGDTLIPWCKHHFGLGIDHILLVFDQLEEPGERNTAESIRKIYHPSRITIWSGVDLMKDGWYGVSDYPELKTLVPFASTGASSQGIPARQALNASAALEIAKTDEFGGAPLDWMIHLDLDELFYLEGPDQGGGSLKEHFSAVTRREIALVRYINHELLHPPKEGDPQWFKLNPRLAKTQLGSTAWNKLVNQLDMAQERSRPYFNGYHNGKSAVAVQKGKCAAGVHSWWLLEDALPRDECFLAGPSILHYRFASTNAFCEKYLAMADTSPNLDNSLFPQPKAEKAALSLIHSMRRDGTEIEEIHEALKRLHGDMTGFSKTETHILDENGLIFTPEIENPLPVDF
jgi:hypothetical protein